MEAAAQTIDYAVTENTEILLDLGPVDSVSCKISDNIVLTSNHAQESLPKTIYACHICDKIFSDNSEMLEHLSLTHATNHTQTEQNKSPLSSECIDSKVEHDYYRKATCTVTSSQCTHDVGQDIASKPYKCAHCGERFKRGSEVCAHMFKHSNTFQHYCDFCGMGCEHQSDLDEHCGLFHSAQKENLQSQHRCGHCGVSFSHRNSLYKHIKCHQDTLAIANDKNDSKDDSNLVILSDVQSSLKEKEKTSRTSNFRRPKKYSCNFCYSKFQTKESLTKHISNHPEWNPTICEVCGEYFAIEIDLKEHQKTHKRKFLPCKVCSRVFMSHKRLEKHRNSHVAPSTQIKTIKVTPSHKTNQICSNKKSRTQLNQNSSKGKIQLAKTKLTSISRENREPLRKCKIPTTKFNVPMSCSLEALSYETAREVATDRTNYKCDMCTKSFPLLKQLTAHMNKWHCAIQQKFDCEYCDSTFSQRMTYFNHLLKHYKKNNYACRHCSLDFKDARLFKEHMQTEHKRKYACSLCPEVFEDQLSRKCHRETAHPRAMVFKCKICSCQFVSENEVKKHVKLHKVRQYKCDICAQAFSRLSLLFQHLVIHAQKLMYKCQYCSKLLPNQLTMHKHLSMHTRPTNVCIVCQKTFQKSENLSKHLQTHLHNGEKPFICCNKTFTDVQQICNHLKLKSHTR